MALEAIGTLHTIHETKQITERFRKREFVIELDDKYPQFVIFQVTGDRCEDLDQYQTGDQIQVSFNLRGREWTSPKTGEVKCFNSLDAWRIECLQRSDRGPDPVGNQAQDDPGFTDDLPF